MGAVCAIALGQVSPALRAAIAELPQWLPVDWTVVPVGDTVQELLTAAADHPGWTTLFVTAALHGDPPLANALAAIMRRYQDLRVVLYGTDKPAVRELVGSLVGLGLTNVAFDTDQPAPTLRRFVELITTDQPRNAVLNYVPDAPVKLAEPLGLDPVVAGAPVAAPGPIRVVRDKVIAVVAGKSGAGKTSLVANLFAVGAQGEAVAAVDCDWRKSALYLHFYDPAHPPAYANFHDLAQTVEQNHSRELDRAQLAFTLTARDREDCRLWVDQSAAQPWRHGILVPGVRRDTPLLVEPLPGLAAQVVSFVRERATVTFVDTPPPWDTAWESLVRTADRVLLLTIPEYEHVLEATDVLRRLDVVGVPRDHISLVINRRSKNWGLATDEIADTLKLKPIAVIPADPRLWEAARQQHQPVALGARAGQWRALYVHLTGMSAPKPRRGRLLSRRARPRAAAL